MSNKITDKITIFGDFPTLNNYIDACRLNRYAAARMKRNVEEIIMLQCIKLKPITAPVIIHFTWLETDKRRDKDNVAFAKKFILDALQKCGKLPNDNNRYIAGFTDGFEYGCKQRGVTVTIENAEE